MSRTNQLHIARWSADLGTAAPAPEAGAGGESQESQDGDGCPLSPTPVDAFPLLPCSPGARAGASGLREAHCHSRK